MSGNTLKLAVPVLLIVNMVVYHNAFQCDFVFDDMSAIKENRDVLQKTDISELFNNDFWGTPMSEERSHKSYRPLTVLTFRLNHHLHGLDPYGYHLVNALLHCAVSIALFLVLHHTMEISYVCSFIASLLFSVHPVHTEAVTGVVGRAELLSALLSLIYFALFVKFSRTSQSVVGVVVSHMLLFIVLLSATLCKEQGITVSAIAVSYHLFIIKQLTVFDIFNIRKLLQDKDFILTTMLTALSTGLILYMRLQVMGDLPEFTEFDNPAAYQPTPYRQLSYLYLLVINTGLLVSPAHLCCDWTMGTISTIKSFSDTRNLFTLLLLICAVLLIKYCLEKRGQLRDITLLSILWIVVPFIPSSNLLFPVGFVVAERVLYIPSIGYCILISYIFSLLYNKYKENRLLRLVIASSMALLIISSSIRTYTRNFDWKNDLTLFKSALQFTENNAKIWNNIGHALEDENPQEALNHFLQAAKTQPDDIGSHINVGRTYKLLGQLFEAERSYRTALELLPKPVKGKQYTARIAPNHLNIFINLGNLLTSNLRLDEAEELYKQAISMRADFTQAFINYGDVLLKKGQPSDALNKYEQALKTSPHNADIHYNMGVVHLELKQHQTALDNLNTALSYDPQHKQSLYNSALILHDTGMVQLRPEAKKRFIQLLSLEPQNENAHFNLGLITTDEGLHAQAEQYFKKAIEIQPSFKAALFNLALLLVNNLKRYEDALTYLKDNVKYNPDHIKSYLLYGDLAINHLKDLQLAERLFQKAVELEPRNIQARHNLCVVYSEKGDLIQAEKCLSQVLKENPGVEYIDQHLQIIRSKLSQS